MKFTTERRGKYLGGLFPMWIFDSVWWVMRVCLVIILLFSVVFATILFLRARRAAMAHPTQQITHPR